MYRFAYADLTNQKLRRDLGGAELTFGKIPSKSTLRFALRFSEQLAGVHVDKYPTLRELRASVGPIDKRPEAGTVSFKVGSGSPVLGTNVTTALTWNFTAEQLATALNALTIVGTAVVVEDNETFLVTGIPEAITTYGNTLRPITFARVESYTVGSTFTQAIRLQRSPYAFTDSFTQKVPAGPAIVRVQAGGENDGVAWNEIQKLTVPREFAGSYLIKAADEIARTGLLGIGDGPEEVGAAMNPTADGNGVALDEDGLFIVTEHPTEPAMFIEFSGSMAGAAQDLLLVTVFDAPPGDFLIDLPLDTPMMSEAFRDTDEVQAVFEIFADIEDPDDPDIVHEKVPVFRGTLTIVESVTHDDLGTAQKIDWTNPPAGNTYLPVSPNSLSSGTRFYPFLAGNGSSTAFTITHSLASPRLRVSLRENSGGGKELFLGTDYRVNYTNDNALVITLLGTYAATPPTTNGLLGTVQDLTLTSTWLPPLGIGIDDVEGLRVILDAYGAAIAALQATAGSGIPVAATTTASSSIARNLPAIWRVLRSREGATLPERPDTLLNWTPYTLEQNPLRSTRVLPAVHDASTETLPNPLPAAADVYKGRVFTTGAARPDFPGGLKAGDFAACDGREWYRVIRESGSESSYYPAAFEVELFRFAVNEHELTARSALDVLFGFEAAFFLDSRNPRDRQTALRWTLKLEFGSQTADTTPGTPGNNLDTFFSSPVIALEQRMILTEVPTTHRFGARVVRDAEGALTAFATRYRKESSTSAPASANFAVRARLCRFDTEDAPIDARGLIGIRGLDVGLDGQPDTTLGKFTIG